MNAITPAHIRAIDAALDRAIEMGVSVRVDAYEVAGRITENCEDGVEIGAIGYRAWSINLDTDFTVVTLRQVGRRGYVETFEVTV